MANAARTETTAERRKHESLPAPASDASADVSSAPAPLFETLSGIPLKAVYTPEDVKPDLTERLGEPGKFPFTRGLHPEMYRKRLWTMRQFAGFGSAEHTNQRFHYLLAQGMTGLSTAFDMPTLMGYDADLAEGHRVVGVVEIGRAHV